MGAYGKATDDTGKKVKKITIYTGGSDSERSEIETVDHESTDGTTTVNEGYSADFSSTLRHELGHRIIDARGGLLKLRSTLHKALFKTANQALVTTMRLPQRAIKAAGMDYLNWTTGGLGTVHMQRALDDLQYRLNPEEPFCNAFATQQFEGIDVDHLITVERRV